MEIIRTGKRETVALESLQGGREENQDCFVAYRNGFGLFVVVCDGMGGGPSGALASGTSSKVMYETFRQAKLGDSPQELLRNAITAANQEIYNLAFNNRELRGMGTTCVCVIVKGTNAYVAHVGDSRLYHLRGGKIMKRTADHSYVAEMVRNGTFTEEQARNSGYSNVITRAIGIKPEVQIEYDFLKLRKGDRIALMSDGIWNMIPEKILVKNLTAAASVSECVGKVVEMVDTLGRDNGGGHDNLTLALIEPELNKKSEWKDSDVVDAGKGSGDADTNGDKPGRRKNRLKVVAALLALMAAAGTGSYFYFWRKNTPDADNGKIIEEYIDDLKDNEVPEDGSWELLEKAVSELKELRNYNGNSPYKENMRRKRIGERRQIVNRISLTLTKAAESTPDSRRREKIDRIIEKIKKSPVMANGIDQKRGLTTRDANKVIDEIINEVENI